MIALIGIGLLIVYWIWNKVFNSAVAKGECTCCGHPGHRAEKCRHRFQFCDMCGEQGHLSSVCTKLTPDERSPYANLPERKLLWILSWIEYLLRKEKQESQCLACGKRGHTSKECRYSNRQCYRCRMKGHISVACPGHRIYRRYKNIFLLGVLVFVIGCTHLYSFVAS